MITFKQNRNGKILKASLQIALIACFLLLSSAGWTLAQDVMHDQSVSAPDGSEEMQPLDAESTMIPHDVVKFRSLDKITAQTKIFEVKVGSTVKYGPLYIKVQSCQKNPPIEAPESAAFVQIWEISSSNKAEWIFSGWMFASSPGLSSMDHPVYDVWVLDCMKLEDTKELDETLEDQQGKDADKADKSSEDTKAAE